MKLDYLKMLELICISLFGEIFMSVEMFVENFLFVSPKNRYLCRMFCSRNIPPQNEAMRRVSALCRTRRGEAVGCVEAKEKVSKSLIYR